MSEQTSGSNEPTIGQVRAPLALLTELPARTTTKRQNRLQIDPASFHVVPEPPQE